MGEFTSVQVVTVILVWFLTMFPVLSSEALQPITSLGSRQPRDRIQSVPQKIHVEAWLTSEGNFLFSRHLQCNVNEEFQAIYSGFPMTITTFTEEKCQKTQLDI